MVTALCSGNLYYLFVLSRRDKVMRSIKKPSKRGKLSIKTIKDAVEKVSNARLLDTRKPDKIVIELLEGLLEQAKSGELISIAGAMVMHNRCTGNFWTKNFPIYLIGELEVCKREVIDNHVDLKLHEGGQSY